MRTIAIATLVCCAAAQAEVIFKEHVINPDAGTGLAIAVADVDGDGRQDIVGVSSSDVAWYENPSWDRHLMADTIKNSNVCVAPHDIDGDGTPEFALGADWQFNNTESGGALFLLRAGGDVREPWTVIPILDEEPTLHRVRWADVEGDGTHELVVAPLKGPGSKPPYFQTVAVDLFLLRPDPVNPFEPRSWEKETIDDDRLHVMHNIWPTRWDSPDKDAILAASYEGVTRFDRADDGTWTATHLVDGNPEQMPDNGAGEIKLSMANRMMATVEPWHGTQAVVYTRADDTWQRHVVDDQIAGGHAVWWTDFDGNGTDELVIGFREKAGPDELPGLNVYWVERNADGIAFTKQVVDHGGMATEDALASDVTGNGKPDIVAFGRATHNIKLYENLGS